MNKEQINRKSQQNLLKNYQNKQISEMENPLAGLNTTEKKKYLSFRLED